MRIQGERVRLTRVVRTPLYVVVVEVEGVRPVRDPSEPCIESETVQYLQKIREEAERGNLEWLRTQGAVYVLDRASKQVSAVNIQPAVLANTGA